jgi:hypothetical protein
LHLGLDRAALYFTFIAAAFSYLRRGWTGRGGEKWRKKMEEGTLPRGSQWFIVYKLHHILHTAVDTLMVSTLGLRTCDRVALCDRRPDR